MYISTSTYIGFVIPDEFNEAMEFGSKYKDWRRTESTGMIGYHKVGYYSIPLKDKDVEEWAKEKEVQNENIQSSK